jgi:hypothetical protein
LIHLDKKSLNVVGGAGCVTTRTLSAIVLAMELLSLAIDLGLKHDHGIGSCAHPEEAALGCRVSIAPRSRIASVEYLNFGANIIHGAVDHVHSGLMGKQILSDGLEVGFVLVLSDLELVDT